MDTRPTPNKNRNAYIARENLEGTRNDIFDLVGMHFLDLIDALVDRSIDCGRNGQGASDDST